MRDFRIDYTNKENPLLDGNNAGNQGEHNATRLIITPPEEMSDCADILVYKIAFELTNNRVIHSDQIEKADTAEMSLPMQITSSPIVSIQLEGYGADGALIAKSAKIAKIMFSKSVCGTEVDYKGEPFGASAELAENSAKLAKFGEDENGNLTYKGNPVGESKKEKCVELSVGDGEIDVSFVYPDSNGFSLVYYGELSDFKVPENAEIISIEFKIDDPIYPEWLDMRDMFRYDINNPYILNYRNPYYNETESLVFLCTVNFTNLANSVARDLEAFKLDKVRVTYIEN